MGSPFTTAIRDREPRPRFRTRERLLRGFALIGWLCAPLSGADGPDRKSNRLAKEKSPYLLQHAHNPVDWFPWGEEAFKKARDEGKPIFLSIGYATCHWCHVMERESFENEAVAAVLNREFVAIKVDREERPDIDDVYMTAAQNMFLDGRGGWPLSVFLTADGKPFYAGTYFPPEDDPQRGRGFRPLLEAVAKVWHTDRERILKSSDAILVELRKRTSEAAAAPESGRPALSEIDAAVEQFTSRWDAEGKGFSIAPKFPRTTILDFLLERSLGQKSPRTEAARVMAFEALEAMARGGIRDHLAGGMHRYSTDRNWTVPHFEKMLYDQALIARSYFLAARCGGAERFRAVGEEILGYVLERLTHADGGFFSAEDADSEGEEGKSYVWSRAEVLEALGAFDGALFCEVYGVTDEGNFEDKRRTVLTVRVALVEAASSRRLPEAEALGRVAAAKAKLLERRNRRPQPLRDDKILTDWNGLGISAFAIGYESTGDKRYLDAAERAADFVLHRLLRDGRLLHRWRDGDAAIPGFLEDYAFFVQGLLDLYEASGRITRLQEASRLAREMVSLFWDKDGSGFFHSSATSHETLIIRRKEFYDGAVPSGNAVAYLSLQRLDALIEDAELRKPLAALDAIAARLAKDAPLEHPLWLSGALRSIEPHLQIVIVGGRADPSAVAMLADVRRRWIPARALVTVEPGDVEKVRATIPLLEGKTAIDGKATAYVCRRGVCRLPARDVETLRAELARS